MHKVIGISQPLILVGHSDQYIPAKIDTGADSSSIWASSISEKDGALSYVLFAPGSVYYTGKAIETHDFSVMVVKNSFGVSESRYKIKLRVKIVDKTYRLSFSLSNRSNSRYPILLGKKFLNGRFLVDVSKDNVADSDIHIPSEHPVVVLSSRTDEKMKSFFVKVAKNISSELLLLNYKSLSYKIDSEGNQKVLLPDGRDISCAKIVYFKSYGLYPEHASAIVAHLNAKSVPFFDRELENSVSRSKLSEIFTLAANNISVPETTVFTGQDSLLSYDDLRLRFGNNFIIKDVDADRGKNNFTISSQAFYDEALSRLNNVKTLIVQRYIENDGFLRVLVMGNEVIQIVKRLSVAHKDPLRDHLNKPNGGVNAIELNEGDCDAMVIKLAKDAARIMRRDVAGVDLIQDKKTKKWYVLEVNYNPEVLGGINTFKKANGLAHFLETGKR